MQSRKIMIAAGGTGGHMFPAQALAFELKQKKDDVLFVGGRLDTNRYLDRQLYPFIAIPSATFSLKTLIVRPRQIISVIRGLWQCFAIIRKYKPEAVVGFGSFHSAPVLLAAVVLRVPILLFESNAWPGRVNRFFSRFAAATGVQFYKTSEYLKGKAELVSMPLKSKDLNAIVEREKALSYFSLKDFAKTVLVFGGSQGAHTINSTFLDVAKVAKDYDVHFQVIHIVGSDDVDTYKLGYEALGIDACVKSFEENMVYAWSVADIVICRSGAATVAEMLHFAVPAIYVPFPKAAEHHQLINALEMEKIGGALCIEESRLNFHTLFKALRKMLQPQVKEGMVIAIKQYKSSMGQKSLESLLSSMLAKTKKG